MKKANVRAIHWTEEVAPGPQASWHDDYAGGRRTVLRNEQIGQHYSQTNGRLFTVVSTQYVFVLRTVDSEGKSLFIQ